MTKHLTWIIFEKNKMNEKEDPRIEKLQKLKEQQILLNAELDRLVTILREDMAILETEALIARLTLPKDK